MKRGIFEWNLWMVLMILTLVEIFRAIVEYSHYGRGLGFALTVIMPLMVLLPLMAGYEIHQIIFLRRGACKKTWIYYGHIILLCVFLLSLSLLLLEVCLR